MRRLTFGCYTNFERNIYYKRSAVNSVTEQIVSVALTCVDLKRWGHTEIVSVTLNTVSGCSMEYTKGMDMSNQACDY